MSLFIKFLLPLILVGCATTQPQRGFWEPQQAWFYSAPHLPKSLQTLSGQVVSLPGPYVKNLYDARVQLSRATEIDFDLVIFEDNEINAFAFMKDSRAKVAFTIGYLQNYGYSVDVIGVTMGHELAHHLLSHVDGRRQDRERKTEAAAQFLGTIASQIIPFSGFAVGTGVRAIGRSYTRDEERAADTLGFELSHKAGFDLCNSKVFWRGPLNTRGSSLTDSFLSTHPGAEERLQSLDAFVRKTGKPECG